MNTYTQLQYIDELINKINWPDDAELYLTFTNKIKSGDYLYKDASVYVSKPKHGGHDAESFGYYFSMSGASLEHAIEQLENELKCRGERV